MKDLIRHFVILILWCAVNSSQSQAVSIPPLSVIPPVVDTTYLTYSQRIHLVKTYIDANLGQAALTVLKPLMYGNPHYPIMLLAAQCYAELNDPVQALKYYESAQSLATSEEDLTLAKQGRHKMQAWIYARSIPPIIVPTQRTVKLTKPSIIRHKTPLAPPEMICTSCEEIFIAKQYLEKNQGQQALTVLTPLAKNISFETSILMAQAHAEINQPRQALTYYKIALRVAKKPYEHTAALYGAAKMQFWLGNYYAAKSNFLRILQYTTDQHDMELARAGIIKSEAYADRPILGFHTIPTQITTPEMLVAAAQTSLWADQSDITADLLEKYQPLAQTINPRSTLGRDLSDVTWQTRLNTHTNVLTFNEFYALDSEQFSLLYSSADYRRYWNYQWQSFVGLDQKHYQQDTSRLNAQGIYFRQKWRPTRTLTLNAKIEPTTYTLWNPILWLADANYRPNDYFGLQFLTKNEVIETFPAFSQHIIGDQYTATALLSPIPYVKFTGSINRLNISDGNNRNGYFIAATTTLSTALGINLTLQNRGYTDKFVSPYYFSPNQYNTSAAIVRVGTKVRSVWHYYVDGGIGTQSIWITGSPKVSSPTRQFGIGMNGPINQYLVLNAYYAMTRQVSAFLGSPDYKYQYGAISLNLLI